jgi:hypothetical protein
MPSYLPFIPTERYYFALVWMTPLILIVILLVQSAAIHVLLRLIGYQSDFDQIVNIIGMSALVVGAVLIPWDWAMYAFGLADQYFLGVTHLIISMWAILIMAVGLRRILHVPAGLSIVASVIPIPLAMPFAIMFMRAPF